MSLSTLATTLIGGFLVGFVFSIFKLPLPVPPLAGLIAAGACLGGSATYQLVHSALQRSTGTG
jgi:XapX domain-containing protein